MASRVMPRHRPMGFTDTPVRSHPQARRSLRDEEPRTKNQELITIPPSRYNKSMRHAFRVLSRLLAWLAVAMVRFYQVSLSPLLVGSCKFHPSCSEYMAQAVREWGLIRGGLLGLRRLVRCRPGTIGGLDPVPKRDVRVPPP